MLQGQVCAQGRALMHPVGTSLSLLAEVAREEQGWRIACRKHICISQDIQQLHFLHM